MCLFGVHIWLLQFSCVRIYIVSVDVLCCTIVTEEVLHSVVETFGEKSLRNMYSTANCNSHALNCSSKGNKLCISLQCQLLNHVLYSYFCQSTSYPQICGDDQRNSIPHCVLLHPWSSTTGNFLVINETETINTTWFNLSHL